MEAHLNARDFLKRFHLPQLVRLSGWDNEQQRQHREEEEQRQEKNQDRLMSTSSSRNILFIENELDRSNNNLISSSSTNNTSSAIKIKTNSINQVTKRSRPFISDDVSISSSFIALNNHQHEKSEWIYKRGNNVIDNSSMISKSQLELSSSSRQQQQQRQQADYHSDHLINRADGSISSREFRSLAISPSSNHHWTNNYNSNNDDDDDDSNSNSNDNNNSKSLSVLMGENNQFKDNNHSDRMLNLIQQQVRMPRASLIQQNHHSKQKVALNKFSSSNNNLINSTKIKQLNIMNQAASKGQNKIKPNELDDNISLPPKQTSSNSYDSIKLIPPCKNVTYSKLDLNQPFLLYKAYKKLEVCAYFIDSKNQINDKSGDPIYFPQNYAGKLEFKELIFIKFLILKKNNTMFKLKCFYSDK